MEVAGIQGAAPSLPRFIRLEEVTRLTGLSRSAIYARQADGSFPKSVSLGQRCVAWIEAEVEHWMLGRIAERDASKAGASIAA